MIVSSRLLFSVSSLFFLGQSLILSILAMSTLRMKCFWGPYICVLASVLVGHPDLWGLISAKLGGRGNRRLTEFLRHIVMGFVIFTLYFSHKQGIHDELQDLR